MEDLPLQVGQVDAVVIHQRDAADAGDAEIHGHRRTEAAGADDQRVRRQEFFLAGYVDVIQQDVARITE